jgi:hypothetical protein
MIIGALRCVWQSRPAGIVLLTMLVALIQLFRVHSDFGLFKDAMFMQPFLLGTLALVWMDIFRRAGKSLAWRSICISALLGVVGWGFHGHLAYTRRSIGDLSTGLTEIPFASGGGLISQLKALPVNRDSVISDTSNVTLAKLEAWYQSPIYFPAKDYFSPLAFAGITKFNGFHLMFGDSVWEPRKTRASQLVTGYFDMHGALPSSNRFQLRRGTPQTGLMIRTATKLSVLNRRSVPMDEPGLTRLVPRAAQKNHLIFVESEFGVSYYVPGIMDRVLGRVSLYQVERDYFFPASSMASLGRDSLFLALNPSPRVRMVLEYTASLRGDGVNGIPEASVIGRERRMLAVAGRGSARLFSPVVELQEILGSGYIALDMGTWGWRFPYRRSKIMSLYGNDVLADLRKMTGFVRDISLIGDEEYASMVAPRAIRRFPLDLADKTLEYSGIYEDGWVGESSYAVLAQPESTGLLLVRLQVPTLGSRGAASELVVLLDGREVERRALKPGLVEVRSRVRRKGKQRVDLRFDRAGILPYPDSRPVCAQLTYLGFESVGPEEAGK